MTNTFKHKEKNEGEEEKQRDRAKETINQKAIRWRLHMHQIMSHVFKDFQSES